MKRKVIQIDHEKCTGCGACANACHQGAIAMVDGKAKLMDENHCDGLGVCLPNCPVDAITLVEKDIEPFKTKEKAWGCPSKSIEQFEKEDDEHNVNVKSCLAQWPCQMQLISPTAPYFDGADLLIAADCCSFAYGNFHEEFIKGKITIIGCPKLDAVDYSEKLAQIIEYNDIKSITVVRMTVPCCGGLTHAVDRAIQKSGKDIKPQVYVITTDGKIQE